MIALLLAGLPIALNAAIISAVFFSHIEVQWRRGRRRKEEIRRLSSVFQSELPLPLSTEEGELPRYERNRSWSRDSPDYKREEVEEERQGISRRKSLESVGINRWYK